jgi:hypothetical protein
MIADVCYFVLGCLVARACLSACKLDKVVNALAIGGIPFHELSHAIACLALGVRVTSFTLLHHDEKQGLSGQVEMNVVRNPFTSLVITIAPAVGGVFWCWLFAWGIGAIYESGSDHAWAWLLLYLAVATGTRSAPSPPDWRCAGRDIAKRPGQFLIGLGGSILAGAICWLCAFPLAEWWHLALLAIAVLGPGVVLSKLYGWKQGG